MEYNDMILASNAPDSALKRSNAVILALAALAGVLGVMATGGEISTSAADWLPQLAALSLPGVVAWVISYLMYQRTDCAGGGVALPLAKTECKEETPFMIADRNTDNGAFLALALEPPVLTA